MTRNTAAWLTAEKARPLQVKEAPDAIPSANEILVKNHAVAINPIDGYLQSLAFFPLQYPTILGQDVAGEVVAVGSGVTQFKEGDRVIGQAFGVVVQSPRAGGFQSHTILLSHVASKIPETMPYEEAVVLPCCYSTAACAFFQEAPFLAMQLPTVPAQKSTGKTILVFGGSSCVGSNAIQLATAAGYDVVTTASPKNFGYVQKLGAGQVFDYNDTSIVDKLVEACRDRPMAGALDCIGGTAAQVCMDVMQKVHGNRAVITTKPVPKEVPEGLTVEHVSGGTMKDGELSQAVWGEFLPRALDSRTLVPAPEPLIAGKGLDKIQDALDLMQKGMSAQKVIVQL